MIKNLKYIVFLLPLLWQANLSFAQDTIPLNSVHSFKASYKPGYTYKWWYTNESGIRTDFTSTLNNTEEILWDTEGNYLLYSQAKDANNCLSEIISKPFVVIVKNVTPPFTVNAGKDTTINDCNPVRLHAEIQKENGVTYTYLWSPAANLDDAAKANPVFTPGATTTFKVTVNNSKGEIATDSMKVTVLINCNTGIIDYSSADIIMYPNPTTDWVTIDVGNTLYVNAEVSVFMDNGTEIFKKTYRDNETIRFDMSSYVTKSYFVRIDIDGKKVVKKLILIAK